jgi:D-alanyl-D-alanine carboxypeptidase
VSIAALATALVLGLAGPAHADTIDYCGNRYSGVVRAIESGTCNAKFELSLGTGPIVHGTKRPARLNRTFYNRYRVARAAARTKGYRMTITSGWRSMSYQAKLYRRSVARNGPNQRWVMPATVSSHPWGLAIDVNYKVGSSKSAKWLETNGYKFGLCRAYKNEWWHFEPLTGPGTPCPKPRAYPAW